MRHLDKKDVNYFASLVGNENVLSDESLKEPYSHDYTEDLRFMPSLVLKPATVEEISGVLKHCNEKKIPVTARGAGTGLSGGALPVEGGIVLAMERLNRIIDIDTQSFQAIVEPGVINEVFQQAVMEKGLFYPPDPASKGSCFLGGNIAHSSGGPRAVKYGTTKDFVLNLQVVLASGEVIWTGANTLKNSTGYNLTQLMVGSEGTLGIVTKIVFRLLPLPRHHFLMLAQFETAKVACECVSKIFMEGTTPSACEFMSRPAFTASLDYLNIKFDLPENAEALLLIELDGNNLDMLHNEGLQVAENMLGWSCVDVLVFDTAEQQEHIWKIRRSIGEAAKHNNVYKEEDTVVPRAYLPALLDQVAEIESRYGFRTIIYGHAGDGNLHINILKDQLSDNFWKNVIPKAITEIFEKCVRLGGTISGEHGIGYVQKPYIHLALSDTHRHLMRSIKNAFDPSGILNPGKIF